jgi:hypothetical protein
MPAGNRVALSATSITSGGMWNSINSTEPTAKQVLAEQAERLLKAKNGARRTFERTGRLCVSLCCSAPFSSDSYLQK